MIRFLIDECCPRAIVDRLRTEGHDVRYAAESDRSAADEEILALANAQNRVIITEDFDFGDLLLRDLWPTSGAVILYLQMLAPAARAERLAAVLAGPNFEMHGCLTIVEAHRVRQRHLHRP